MITFSKVKESDIEDQKRILKVDEFGVKTTFESAPFGLDPNPLKDMIGIYGKTSNNSESVILGYINKNQISGIGENRIYSLMQNGSLSAYIHLRSDETIEINGDTNYLVKYNELKIELDSLITKLNTEFIKIQTAITALSGAYASVPLTMDTNSFKNDKIKQNS